MRLENRCCGRIFNIKKKRYYRCKKCYYNTLYNNYTIEKYCWNHYNKKCKFYIIIIQRYYRGYKCRRIIKNIYRNLPDDIQKIIIDYIREDLYYKRYHNALHKIIKRRYHIYYNLQINNNAFIHMGDVEFLDIFSYALSDVYYLYNKYFDIIHCDLNNDIYDEFIYLNLFIYTLINKLRHIAQHYFYELSETNIDNNSYLLKYYNKLNTCLTNVTEFSKKSENIKLY